MYEIILRTHARTHTFLRGRERLHALHHRVLGELIGRGFAGRPLHVEDHCLDP